MTKLGKYLRIAVLLLIVKSISLQAQNISSSYNNWATYFLNYKFSNRWGIHFDTQFRGDEEFRNIKQHLVRGGIQYSLKSNIHLTIGYAHVNTFSTGFQRNLSEYRPWQQFIWQHNFTRAHNTLRIRLEQRWSENYTISNNVLDKSEMKYGNRIRLFNRFLYDLLKKETSTFYLALQNEFFLNFPENQFNKNLLDQNRFLLAIGIFKNGNTRFEIGYMNQFITPSNANYSDNHILHLSVLQNFAPKITQQVPKTVEK